MRIFLEKMVLDFPDVIDADPIGEFDLSERILVELPFGIPIPFGAGRAGQLMLIKNAELHRDLLRAPLPHRGRGRDPARSAGRVSVCDTRPPSPGLRSASATLSRTAGEGIQRVQARIACATASGWSSSARWPAPGIVLISVLPEIPRANLSA